MYNHANIKNIMLSTKNDKSYSYVVFTNKKSPKQSLPSTTYFYVEQPPSERDQQSYTTTFSKLTYLLSSVAT